MPTLSIAMAAALASFSVVVLLAALAPSAGADANGHPASITVGFKASHNPAHPSPFEPLLYSGDSAFALGFIRINNISLDLAVVHLASAFPVWRATPARMGNWSTPARLQFTGDMVLDDPVIGLLWSTESVFGDYAVLFDSGNLQIRRREKDELIWESFRFPSNTLIAGQDFTVQSKPLFSDDQRFTMQVHKTFIALYMPFFSGTAMPMYFKRSALEADPQNASQPAIVCRVHAEGYLMLTTPGVVQHDLIPFISYGHNITGLRRLTLEDDGNLRAYRWEGSSWLLELEFIGEQCNLPTACGAYALCTPGGAGCSCLVNGTGGCHREDRETLCGGGEGANFYVVRRAKVGIGYKPTLAEATLLLPSKEACESKCAGDCRCWGALYSLRSGECHLLDFPIETLTYESDPLRTAYIKVRLPATDRSKIGAGVGVALVVVVLAGLIALLAFFGYTEYENRRKGWRQLPATGGGTQELSPTAYQDHRRPSHDR